MPHIMKTKTTLSSARSWLFAFECGVSLLGLAGRVHAAGKIPSPPPPAFASLPEGSAVRLGELPPEIKWTSVSGDGRRILMTGPKGSRHAAYLNGVPGGVYDEIVTSVGRDFVFMPRFTADGATALHLARRGNQIHIVANGRESAPYEGVIGAWTAPKGDGYAMMAKRGNRMVVHRDGADLADPFPDITNWEGNFLTTLSHTKYSPDGRHFVYLSDQNSKAGKRTFQWILDNKPLTQMKSLPPNMESGGWVFGGADSFAYHQQDTLDSVKVVFKGVAGSVFLQVQEPKITDDGKQVVYLASRKLTEKELDICVPRQPGENDNSHRTYRNSAADSFVLRLIRDGVEVPLADEPLSQPMGLVISSNGRLATAYPCRWEHLDARGRPSGRSSGIKVWIDGESSMDYDGWHGTSFGPDGSLAVSFVSKDQQYFALVNGEELGPYAAVDPTGLSFAPDGKGYLFPATLTDRQTVLIVDGKPSQHRYDGGFVRSANGATTAYVSARGKHASYDLAFCNLIVGDKVHEIPGQVVDIVLSQDGSRVACVFNTDPDAYEDVRMQAWVDGELMPPLAGQSAVGDMEFSPDGKHFSYTARVSVKEHPDAIPGASGHDLHVRVINGRPGPAVYLNYQVQTKVPKHGDVLGEAMYRTTFEPDGSVGYFARHDKALWRVSLSPQALAGMPDLKTLTSKTGEEQVQKAAIIATDQEAEKMSAEQQAKAAERFRILHRFGAFEPDSGFVIEGPDGRLYGGEVGGRFDLGQLFSIGKDGSDYKVLRTFEGDGEKGVAVNSLFFDKNGLLYGTTKPRLNRGDPECAGTIFRHDPSKGVHENLYVCARRPINGMMDAIQEPMLAGSRLSEANVGKLYGLTSGVMGHFVFGFEVAKNAAEIVHHGEPSASTLHRDGAKLLVRSPDWRESAAWREAQKAHPQESKPVSHNLEMLGERIYSIFEDGGRGEAGKVVSLSPDGSGYTVVYDFAFKDPVGAKPHPWLIDGRDGLLYGATSTAGEQGKGAIFVLKPDGSECRVICPLHGNCNNVLAMTARNGAVYFGTHDEIWQVSPGAKDPVKLHGAEGMVRSLVVGDDGNLYGSTTDQVFSYRLK